MSDVVKLINKELAIADSYIDNNKIESINRIGNRVLQNLFILNKKELMICGQLLKRITINFDNVKTNKVKTDIDNYKLFAKEFIKDLRFSLGDDPSPLKVWNSYFDFMEKVRKYPLGPEERTIYDHDSEFSGEATINYINFISSNKNLLLNRNIYLLTGTRVQFENLIKMYGGRTTIIGFSLVDAFERVCKFALHGNVSDEELESVVNININRFNEIAALIQGDDEEKVIVQANIFIGDLLYDIRKYFILFGELNREEITLSPSVEKKLRKIVETNKRK